MTISNQVDILALMNSDNLPKRSLFRCLFENITGKGTYRYLDVDPEDTAGESEPACNKVRSLVYDVKTTSGWKVFRRSSK